MTEQRTDHKRRFISRYSQEEMSFYIETTLDEKKKKTTTLVVEETRGQASMIGTFVLH